MYDYMAIDGRNCIYRAIYAGLSENNQESVDPVVIFFRFISSYLMKYKSNSIHFFWDSPKEKVWRRRIYPAYKDGRVNARHEEFDIEEMLSRCTTIVMEMINILNSRSYARDGQEADDLIYAFCRQCANNKILIISSDGDFKQIPYLYHNIDLFNPLSKLGTVLPRENVDPVEVKSFSGEKSDNIDGYCQIGPVRARSLVCDLKKREEFFKIHKRKTYLRNRALIDLSLCPYLLANINYVIKVMTKDIKYDEPEIRNIIQKYKVKGLSGEISKSLMAFRPMR